MTGTSSSSVPSASNSTSKLSVSLHKHSIAGLGAGAISTATLYPLDLVKTHFQVHEGKSGAYRSVLAGIRDIVRQNGARGLYRGMSPALYGASCSWGLYFYFYERAKQRYASWNEHGNSSSWQHFASGMEAGMMCVPLTNPIWLIKVRMQVQAANIDPQTVKRGVAPLLKNGTIPYRSVTDAFRRIIAEEGVMALYKGVVPALFLTSHGAFKFLAYEKLKSLNLAHITSNPTMFHSLVIGASAQAFATTTTYPYQVVKARLQQGGEAAMKFRGTWHCFQYTVRNEGFTALYKGLSANLMKVVPSGALTFALYEVVIKVLDQIDHE